MARADTPEPVGRGRRVGTDDDVAWINAATTVGPGITAAVPPVFARYATVVVPDDDADKTRADQALIEVFAARSPGRSWWLGYLQTGVADLVVADAARVLVYTGWPYVLLEGGPEDALTGRPNSAATPWHSAVPELIFPADRSWLVSTLWDDDWRCIGASGAVIEALARSRDLDVREVTPEQDATPPGHQAR